MASAPNLEPWYVSLLGLAETFRTSNPPNIRLCIHCLQSILNFKPSARIEARTHLQLGNILLTHTKNIDLAKTHLEKAWSMSNTMPSADDIKFEAASVLVQIFEKQNQLPMAKPVLMRAVEISQQAPYWHCRLLFQLAQIHSAEKDYQSACNLLGVGAEFAATAHSDYTRLLFLLSKGMLLLIDKKMDEVHKTLSQAGTLIESYNGQPVQKESLKVFFLILQVCHYLMAGQQKDWKRVIQLNDFLSEENDFLSMSCLGISSRYITSFVAMSCLGISLVAMLCTVIIWYMIMKINEYRKKYTYYVLKPKVKSVKPALKNLQQIIQTITQLHTDEEPAISNPIESFHWLPIEHMCVLVYLVTVMHSMQAGYMDKAQKYTDKALMQIEKLKMLDAHPLLSTFQLMLLEHIIMCRLIMGNKTLAIQEIFQACHVCQQQPRLFTTHGAQIHTLLGLYAMSMNCMEAAEAQFKTAVKMSPETELALFVHLNLAIVYLRTNRQEELVSVLQKVEPEKISGHSHSLKASAYYVQGLQSFFAAKYNEAKRYLRETLKMANAEDLNRLTSCSLVLLGHIFLSLGNNTEALNMVTPAMQLAGKIPDVHVQLWASSLLKDLYRLSGDKANETEGYNMHANFSQSLLNDHFQSSNLSEHGLIQWTEGQCPFHLNTSSVGSSNML